MLKISRQRGRHGLGRRARTAGSKAQSGEQGSALMEFAVGMMLFFSLMFAAMAFSQALYAYHFISYAAREGARYAAVRGSACTTFASACPASASDVGSYVVGLSPGGIDTTNYQSLSSGGVISNSTILAVITTWPGNGAGTCATTNSPGCPVKVKIQYKYKFSLPLVSSSSITMTSASQMIISQ